jgi:hypothetical protein
VTKPRTSNRRLASPSWSVVEEGPVVLHAGRSRGSRSCAITNEGCERHAVQDCRRRRPGVAGPNLMDPLVPKRSLRCRCCAGTASAAVRPFPFLVSARLIEPPFYSRDLQHPLHSIATLPPLSRRRSGIGVSACIGSGAITEAGDLISALDVMKPKTPANPFGRSVKTWPLRRDGCAKGRSIGDRHVPARYKHLFSINP